MIHIIFLVLICIVVGDYFIWRIACTLPVHSGPVAVILGILLLLAEFLITFKMMVQFFSYVRNRKFHLELPSCQEE